MLDQTLRPSPPLADVIERLWLREGPAPRHAFDRVLPMRREELIFNQFNEGLANLGKVVAAPQP
jgi:hypothetical protein